MSPPSPSRGRSRSRTVTPIAAKQADISPRTQRTHSLSRSRSPRRSISPRSRSYSLSASRSPGLRNSRNRHRGDRSITRSVPRSRSPRKDGSRKSYRERSYTRSLSRQSRRPQSSKIVIEMITKNVTEAHLREIFGSYGQIEALDLPINRQFMTNRGTAYILYTHPSASESAIAHMHGAQLDGAVITVSIVLPRRAFSRSPPPAKSNRAPPAPYRNGPPPRGPPGRGYRSPDWREEYGGGRRSGPNDDSYVPRRSYSRSVSPPPKRGRGRSYSYSRSRSRTPPRRHGVPPRGSSPRRRRRSPSYSSYSSYDRSRSRSRSRSKSRGGYDRRR